MKTSLVGPKDSEVVFPCLMRNSSGVVIMATGIAVNNGYRGFLLHIEDVPNLVAVGFTDEWDGPFIPLNKGECVVLEND